MAVAEEGSIRRGMTRSRPKTRQHHPQTSLNISSRTVADVSDNSMYLWTSLDFSGFRWLGNHSHRPAKGTRAHSHQADLVHARQFNRMSNVCGYTKMHSAHASNVLQREAHRFATPKRNP
jgi:hypothetical protein